MRRRQFIAALAGVVAAAPALRLHPAFAEQAETVRHIGVLMGLSESDPAFQVFVSTFARELARLGWIDGRDVRIEQRWTNADVNRASALAKELVAAQPDVILASTTPATAALKRESSTIPIVFTIVSDPVGVGFVASLAHPGGNITGFTHTDSIASRPRLGLAFPSRRLAEIAHKATAGIPPPQKYSAHRQVHRAIADTVQEFLPRMSNALIAF
jgi:ABC-type uncharacterized transport system substrate-binding protein